MHLQHCLQKATICIQASMEKVVHSHIICMTFPEQQILQLAFSDKSMTAVLWSDDLENTTSGTPVLGVSAKYRAGHLVVIAGTIIRVPSHPCQVTMTQLKTRYL